MSMYLHDCHSHVREGAQAPFRCLAALWCWSELLHRTGNGRATSLQATALSNLAAYSRMFNAFWL